MHLTTVFPAEGPKDPLANAMAEMMDRIKSGNMQLKPVRSVCVVEFNSNLSAYRVDPFFLKK